MSYTPPSADNITFDFTDGGYTAPAEDNIVFEFGLVGNEVLAPPAVFYIQGLGSVRTEVVIAIPPAKFEQQGLGKGALHFVVTAPPGRFNHQALADIAYTVYVIAPPAKFLYQGIVEYVDSYKPPAYLTDFINMTNARRDKAISYDKQHTFDMGPVERANIDEGLLAKSWRLRVDGTSVYLAVEGTAGWEEEFLEFTLPHLPVFSMDLTFDQNGYPFACWEYNGQVWIYWYDPLVNNMQIDYVCAGRTPRARLDSRSRHQLPDSDIYIFYLNDSADELQYRIQRDRYDTAYTAPLLIQEEETYEEIETVVVNEAQYKSVQNLYLEVLAMANDWRLYIWASEYLPENEGTHYPTYQFFWRHSAIYPYYFVEDMEVRMDRVEWGEHSNFHSMLANEDTIILDDIVSVSVKLAILFASMTEDEIADFDVDEVLSVAVRVAILSSSMYKSEFALLDTDAVLSASLRIAIITMSMYYDELTTIHNDNILGVTKVAA